MNSLENTYRKINKVIIVLVIALSYGFLLANPSIGIDDENFEFYFRYDGLLSSGRWGYWLLKRILPTYEYLPIWRDCLALIVLLLALFLMIYCIDSENEGRLAAWAINAFMLIGVSYPIMTRMFLYIDNSFEVSFSLLMAVLSYMAISSKKKKRYIAGFFLLVIGNAVNENCSIFFCIFVSTMVYFDAANYAKNLRQVIRDIIPMIISLIVALLCETELGHFLANVYGVGYKQSYATGAYIMWGKQGIKETISLFWANFCVNLQRYFNEYFSVKIFVIAFIFWLAESLHCLIKRERGKSLASAGVGILSVSMLLITANGALPIRIFTTNLIAVAAAFVAIYCKIQEKNRFVKEYTVLFCLLLFFTIFYSTKESNELYQLDYLRYQRDADIARTVNYDLIKCNNGNPQIPVIFLGGISGYSDIDSEGEVALMSIYTENMSGESIRIHRFFDMLGYCYPNALQQGITGKNYNEYKENPLTRSALNYAVKMPAYPEEGYIVVLDNMIIVKLTDF